MTKLTAEQIDEWLAALESGKYAQTTGSLKDHEGYCCLGVLCDVLDPNGWNPDNSYTCARHKLAPEDGSEVVVTGMGLGGYENPRSFQYRLAKKNDDGASFTEIARFIREKIRPKIVG